MSAGFTRARLLRNRLERDRHLRKGDLAGSAKGEWVSSVSSEEIHLSSLVLHRPTDVPTRTLGNENLQEEVRGDVRIDGHRTESVTRSFFRVTRAGAHEGDQLLGTHRD